jgi:hypothetical protein
MPFGVVFGVVNVISVVIISFALMYQAYNLKTLQTNLQQVSQQSDVNNAKVVEYAKHLKLLSDKKDEEHSQKHVQDVKNIKDVHAADVSGLNKTLESNAAIYNGKLKDINAKINAQFIEQSNLFKKSDTQVSTLTGLNKKTNDAIGTMTKDFTTKITDANAKANSKYATLDSAFNTFKANFPKETTAIKKDITNVQQQFTNYKSNTDKDISATKTDILNKLNTLTRQVADYTKAQQTMYGLIEQATKSGNTTNLDAYLQRLKTLDDNIQLVQKNISALQDNLGTLTKDTTIKIQANATILSDLQTRARDLLNNVSKQQTELNNASRVQATTVSQLKAAIESLQQKIASSATSSSSTATITASQLVELQGQLSTFQREMNKVLDTQGKDIALQKDQITKLTDQLSKLPAQTPQTMADIRTKLGALTSETTTQYQKITATVDGQKTQLTSIGTMVNDINAKIGSLDGAQMVTKLNDASNALNALVTQASQYVSLTKYNADMDSVKQQIVALTANVEQLRKSTTDTTNRLGSLPYATLADVQKEAAAVKGTLADYVPASRYNADIQALKSLASSIPNYGKGGTMQGDVSVQGTIKIAGGQLCIDDVCITKGMMATVK